MARSSSSERQEIAGPKGPARALPRYDSFGLVVSAIKLLVVGTLLGGMALVSFALLIEGVDNRNYWLEKTYTVEEMEYVHGGR